MVSLTKQLPPAVRKIVASIDFPLMLAVIWTVPADLPETRPVAETVARVELLDDHVAVDVMFSKVPSLNFADAESCWELELLIVIKDGFTEISVTVLVGVGVGVGDGDGVGVGAITGIVVVLPVGIVLPPILRETIASFERSPENSQLPFF